MRNNFAEIAIEFGLVYAGLLLFFFVGKYFLRSVFAIRFDGKYENTLHPIVAGLLVTISLYAIVVAKGVTIQILMVPLLFLLYKTKLTNAGLPSKKWKVPFFEIALVALVSVFILHLFPESEYKQADSFFYLKIAESLNQTGQENINHYYNGLMDIYHGVEPYHYFEIWVTSFFIKITGSFYNHIAIQRFITQGVFLSTIIVGLYYLVELLNKGKVSWYHKIFCFALLFFMPNVLSFLPSLYNYFISDFEGNLLERPNFRIIYLLLIPVISQFIIDKKFTKPSFYFLLVLCVVTFKCAVVVIPALVIFGILQRLLFKQKMFPAFWPGLILFVIAFGIFYYVFGVKSVPGLFGVDTKAFLLSTLKGWKFILFSILMSGFYIVLIAGFFLLPVLFSYKRKSLLWNKEGILLLGVTCVIGLVMARILYLKDNAYQFLFLTHIVVSLGIWLLFFIVLVQIRSQWKWLGATLFLSFLFFVRIMVYPETQVDTFKQNGNFVYEGKKYSEEYIEKVSSFLKANEGVKGAYLAGKEFYHDTYYSRRNPNVYFLPISYIMASRVNNNIEFCISDSLAIMTDISQPVFADYLRNSIVRSAFYQFQSQYQPTHPSAKEAFIRKFHLQYLIATKDAQLETSIQQTVKSEWIDNVTGERFFVLSDAR